MKKLLLFLLSALLSSAAPPTFNWNSETIHCGNLVYGEGKTAICFASQFLTDAKKATGLNISPKFISVNLAKEEVFNTPYCIFTGQDDFKLSAVEQTNLRRYLENGGFILASPGCSDKDWNKAFTREMATALPGYEFREIPMEHELFSTVNDIKKLTVSGKEAKLQGLFINERLALVYSPEGLNNASNAEGCCCCGGAEIKQSLQVNVNSVAYALLY